MSELWQRENYTIDADFIIGSFIVELDIEKCNINVLYNANVIDLDTYNFLYNTDKHYREVWVGNNILKNNNTNNRILSDGITEARRRFFEVLNLDDNDIISIRKDSIFFVDKQSRFMGNGVVDIPFDKSPIRFKQKGVYTSFYKLKRRLIALYNNGRVTPERLSIAGIGDDNLISHENYFSDFLKALFQTAEFRGTEEAINLLKIFYLNYINLRLDTGYYREYNSFSRFRVKRFSIYPNQDFMLDEVSDESKNSGEIDISYNENILRTLMKIYSTKYLSERRKGY